MDVQINLVAVVLAALSSMVVGSLWYMPATFGNYWMKLAKVKPDRRNMTPLKMTWMYGSVLVASLVTAYILAHVTYLSNHFFHNTYLQASLGSAFWLWLGFTAARFYVHDTFEERRKMLT